MCKRNCDTMVIVYLALCVLFFVALRLYSRASKGSLPPGPKGSPVIGVALDLNPQTAHLTIAKWAETYGAIHSFKVFGLTSIVISDARLIRKAYSSEKYQSILNDRPDTFVGKHLVFNYSDVGFAKYHEATLKLRKCLHKALRFYGDGVKKFENLFTRELEHLVEEFAKSPEKAVIPRDGLEHSFCRLIINLVSSPNSIYLFEFLINLYHPPQ